MDVMQTIDEYGKYLHTLGYARSTIECYGGNLALFKAWLLDKGITDIRKVTYQTVLDYQGALMKKPIGMESKAARIRPVKRLFEHLTASNRLLIDPTRGIVEISRKNRGTGFVLNPDELRELLSRPDLSRPVGIRNRAVMELLYSTGIRLGELESLEMQHLDMQERVIHIPGAKGGCRRVVPLGKRTAAYVRLYLQKVRPHFAVKNTRKSGESPTSGDAGHPKGSALFLNHHGAPLSRGSIQGFIRMYGIDAGIRNPVSAHVLRRTCATRMLQNGKELRHVQKLLGHRRLSTTRFYTRHLPAEPEQPHERSHPDGGKNDENEN